MFGAEVLPRLEDEEVIDCAFKREAILLTTEQRFIAKCREYQKFLVGKGERCCFGLVILYPDTEFAQSRVLNDLKRGRKKIRYRNRMQSWQDVLDDNLVVRIQANGQPIVSELCDCPWNEERSA